MRITIDTDAKTFILHGEVNVGEFLNFIQKNFPGEIVDNWTILNEKELEQEVEKISAPLPSQDGNPINIPLNKPFEWPEPYTPYPTNPWPWTNPWPITPIYCTLSNDPIWSEFATKS